MPPDGPGFAARARAGLVWLAVGLVGLGLAVVLLAQLAQILGRVVGPLGLAGTDELSRFAFVWASFLGVAAGLELGAHHAFTRVRDSLPPRLAGLAAALAEGLVLLALGLLAWHGVAMSVRAHAQVSPALGLPMSWLYAALPAAAGLMILLVLLRWRGRSPP